MCMKLAIQDINTHKEYEYSVLPVGRSLKCHCTPPYSSRFSIALILYEMCTLAHRVAGNVVFHLHII